MTTWEAEDDPVFDQTPVKVVCPHCRPLEFFWFWDVFFFFLRNIFLVAWMDLFFFWFMEKFPEVFCLGHEPSEFCFFFGWGGIQKAPYECFFLGCFFFLLHVFF